MAKIICPKCGANGPIPADLASDRIRCKACGERFRVPDLRPAATDPPPPPGMEHESPRWARLAKRTIDRAATVRLRRPIRPCPFCREPIRVDALKCKHCGEFFDGTPPSPRAAAPAGLAAPAAAGTHKNGVMFHATHLAMTVVTGGRWLPVWLLHSKYEKSQDR